MTIDTANLTLKYAPEIAFVLFFFCRRLLVKSQETWEISMKTVQQRRHGRREDGENRRHSMEET